MSYHFIHVAQDFPSALAINYDDALKQFIRRYWRMPLKYLAAAQRFRLN